MSNFEFLTAEWQDIHDVATRAKSTAFPPPYNRSLNAQGTLAKPNGETVGWGKLS